MHRNIFLFTISHAQANNVAPYQTLAQQNVNVHALTQHQMLQKYYTLSTI